MSQSRYHGWRIGIILGCIMSFVVLLCNIAILVYGATRENDYRHGLAVLATGRAKDMSWWTSAFHVAINVLSTLLLGASNYTMQVLSSPTRGDIDHAHAGYKWLDVGILSTRNLGWIPRRRRVLFGVMALSSIPIHLL